jgi:hypothetical protein
VGGAVDHRHHGAVLAGDIDETVRAELERMRRDVGPQIDVADVGAFVQIDDAEQMTGIGIAAVDAVTEDRHVGEAGFRQHEQLVHRALKTLEHDLGLVAHRIEKQDLCPHLVDRDQSARAACLGHCSVLPLLPRIVGADCIASRGRNPSG